jgi:hypothetical protein
MLQYSHPALGCRAVYRWTQQRSARAVSRTDQKIRCSIQAGTWRTSPLADVDLAGAVVTADALHPHAEAAAVLATRKQADSLVGAKANQPTLLDRCAALAWHNLPVLDRTRDQGHGPVELRTLKAVSVRGVGFPHASQVLQVTRKVRDLATRRWRTTVVDAVTSLAHAHAGPARLADLIRGHRPSKRPARPPRRRPSPRTPPNSAPAPPPRSWRPWATWSSAPSAAPGRSTSPPRSDSTAATPADHPHPTTAAGSGRRRVSTTGPPSVIARVCSEWAVREPSAARIVQPSGSKAI